jgi:hypothetical protein
MSPEYAVTYLSGSTPFYFNDLTIRGIFVSPWAPRVTARPAVQWWSAEVRQTVKTYGKISSPAFR